MSYNESLRSDSNYPPMSQSEWDRAPWNEEQETEVEVTALVSIEKTLTLKVPQDYSQDDLETAFENAEKDFIDLIYKNNYELENIEVIE